MVVEEKERVEACTKGDRSSKIFRQKTLKTRTHSGSWFAGWRFFFFSFPFTPAIGITLWADWILASKSKRAYYVCSWWKIHSVFYIRLRIYQNHNYSMLIKAQDFPKGTQEGMIFKGFHFLWTMPFKTIFLRNIVKKTKVERGMLEHWVLYGRTEDWKESICARPF